MLIICEKPNQAKDIARVLEVNSRKDGYFDGKYKITWCFGHLITFLRPDEMDENLKQWTLNALPIVPDNWKMKTTSHGASKQLKTIRTLLKGEKEVTIATDADREGEMIGREILEYCGYKGSVKRLWLSALDDESIKKAFNNLLPGKNTYPLYKEAQARSKADWLYGMNYSRAYGLKTGMQNISVGRVQTSALAIVVQKDLEIENFKFQTYFELYGIFSHSNGDFKAKWIGKKDEKVQDKRIIDALIEKLKGQKAFVLNINKKLKKESSPKLFSLSELQKRLNVAYGFTAQETLDIAQNLYETHKATTYPRTDCQYLPLSQLSEIKTILANAPLELKALAGVAPRQTVHFSDTEVNKSAHHAIIPTLVKADINKMTDKEKKAYFEIFKRYISMFYPDYVFEETILTTALSTEPFEAKGQIVREQGWRKIYSGASNEKKDEDHKLPVCEIKAPLGVKGLNAEEKKTKPPARFTEGTLIEAMKNAGKFTDDKNYKEILKESKGIGTEATRANIIEILFKREYLTKKAKNIISTKKGRVIIKTVDKNIKNVVLTAVWEEDLARIGNGQLDAETFLRKLTAELRADIETLKNNNLKGKGNSMEKEILEGAKCPKCGSSIIVTDKNFKCVAAQYSREEGSSGCDFIIWKNFSGITITAAQACDLANGKKVFMKKLKPFDKTKKPYNAFIYWRCDGGKNKLKREFEHKDKDNV